MPSIPLLFRLSIRSIQLAFCVLLLVGLPLMTSCGKSDSESGSEARGGHSGGEGRGEGRGSSGSGRSGRPSESGGPGGFGDSASKRGVPVEISQAERRPIALFFETQGTLEAENEVDLISRVAGPVLELRAEQGDRVRKGDLLARIDDREIRAQASVAEVRLSEAQQSYERVRKLHEQNLISRDAYDQALAAFEAAKGEFERLTVQLEYTRIVAPFGGLVAERYVKLAETVQNGSQLFRLVDFDPLLVPIRVPERELPRLALGQKAQLRVEAFGDRRFDAEVLRMSPVVDPASGTVEVTLKIAGEGLLRPGMFATVFLEMDRRSDALVVPKAALALDSLGNTIYVVSEGAAERRDLQIGFRNEDLLEVLAGVEVGEPIVVVGQDGLADGTPVEVVEARTLDGEPLAGYEGEAGSDRGTSAGESGQTAGQGGSSGGGGPGGGGPPGGFGGGMPDWLRNLDWNDEEQVDRVKVRMKERGLSDAEVEERVEQMKKRFGGESSGEGGR